MKEFRGRVLVKGEAEGEALVIDEISFYGDINPNNGMLVDGRNVKDKIIVAYKPKGSTVGSYIIYALKENGFAPRAIIMSKSEPIIIAGCVLANIPLVDNIDINVLKEIKDGDKIIVKNDKIKVK
jgi:predicted aconitase with swiveling domain